MHRTSIPGYCLLASRVIAIISYSLSEITQDSTLPSFI